jgi:16S rRNA (cytosine967-C5)-methyltransferase
LKPEWNEKISLSIEEKITLTQAAVKPADIFPWQNELSEGIEKTAFSLSHFIQPFLFVRIRQKARLDMMQRLEKTSWPFTIINNNCIALPNGCNVEEVFDIDRNAVVQDYNSQQVFNYAAREEVKLSLKPFRKYYSEFRNVQVLKAFDCCAGSGGKSILLYDLMSRSIKPTVCDIRLPILLNLHQRFKKANLRYYDYFVGDMEKNILPEIADSPFPVVICDVPCTGSGTWGRTPEQLFYFEEKMIDNYAARQQKIVTHAVPHLAKGGLLFYITCSVFKKENENIAAFIQKKFSLKPVYTELLKGYDKKADSMFVAVFKK